MDGESGKLGATLVAGTQGDGVDAGGKGVGLHIAVFVETWSLAVGITSGYGTHGSPGMSGRKGLHLGEIVDFSWRIFHVRLYRNIFLTEMCL